MLRLGHLLVKSTSSRAVAYARLMQRLEELEVLRNPIKKHAHKSEIPSVHLSSSSIQPANLSLELAEVVAFTAPHLTHSVPHACIYGHQQQSFPVWHLELRTPPTFTIHGNRAQRGPVTVNAWVNAGNAAAPPLLSLLWDGMIISLALSHWGETVILD